MNVDANLPDLLLGGNTFTDDPTLSRGVERFGGGHATAELTTLGGWLGSDEAVALGIAANRFEPELATHDRWGRRLDVVDFHPAYHALMGRAVAAGIHSSPWEDGAPEGAHVARAAGMFLISRNEQGHGCPISMTYAVAPSLAANPDAVAEWLPKVTTRSYDPSFAPATEKAGALFGMAMTERQGGSDVRANVTTATPAGGDVYRLDGHKHFCSAPMNDAFLVLAQAPGGLTCFLLPRWTPDGEVNGFRIERLKDKLGNRSNASSEVSFEAAWALRIGDEGRGVPTIIEMVNGTRLDCVIGAAAIMRESVAQALHHARNRATFGRVLIDHPLMANVLADLVLESEAATWLMLRLAATFDRPEEDALRRILTPLAKFWVTKRCPIMVNEALECLGGAGYVEESPMPRLFRESPLNAIWEGSGNVIALDTLRALRTSPGSADALLEELEWSRGRHEALDPAIDRAKWLLAEDGPRDEAGARRLVRDLALTVQAAVLIREADDAVADAFTRSRLADGHGGVLGTLPAGLDLDGVLAVAPRR
ncbi:MAG: acyl-CoA dehydrogenase family protein [Acidimicrobiia bacterium]